MKIYNQTAITNNNYQNNTARKHNTTPNFKATVNTKSFGDINIPDEFKTNESITKYLNDNFGKVFSKEKITQILAEVLTALGVAKVVNNSDNTITEEEKQKLNNYLRKRNYSGMQYINEYRSFSMITPLIYASTKGSTDIVRLLLKHPDINVNMQDEYGFTALIRAAMNDMTKTVKVLLNHPNIDVNMQNKYGETALIRAASNGNTEIVKALLENPNIDVNIQDNYGETAMDSMPEIVQWKKEIDERKAKEVQEAKETIEAQKNFEAFGFKDIDYYNLSTYEKVLNSDMSKKAKEKIFNEKQNSNEDTLLNYLAGNPFMQDENSQKRLETILKKMEDLDINYNQKDRYGSSALENIMYSSNIVFLRHYIKKKATTDYSPRLDVAYKSIQSEEFKKLLDDNIYDVVNFKDVKEAIKSQSNDALKSVSYQMHSPFFDMSHQV